MVFKRTIPVGSASRRAVLTGWLAVAPLAAHAAALRAAVFAVELDDTSLVGEMGGPHADETKRLAMATQQLRRELAQSGFYSPVPLGAVAQEADAVDLRHCGGCDATLALKAGAQVSVVSWVQKVSALILNINAVIRDAKTGTVLRDGSVDIRGDTDESWSRGITYLVRNRLLAPDTRQ